MKYLVHRRISWPGKDGKPVQAAPGDRLTKTALKGCRSVTRWVANGVLEEVRS